MWGASGRKWRKSKKSRIPPPSIGVDPGGTWGARGVVWSTIGKLQNCGMNDFSQKVEDFSRFLKLDLFDRERSRLSYFVCVCVPEVPRLVDYRSAIGFLFPIKS